MELARQLPVRLLDVVLGRILLDSQGRVIVLVVQSIVSSGLKLESANHSLSGWYSHCRTTSFDCVITDLRMPGIDGRAVLRWVKEHQPDVDVLMLTGHGEIKDAVDAIKNGAWDFLVKEHPVRCGSDQVRID